MENIAYGALAIWALKELYSVFKDKSKAHTEAVMQNTLAITELRVELRHIKEALIEMPKMKKDVDALHSKFRDLSK